MANPSGFESLASPLPLDAVVELELDPFDDAPKAEAFTIKAAQATTTGLRRGPKKLSNVRMSNLQFVGGT
jgi:hypothetical protein